jgi:O-antigen/teichoic acid export membrane protein
VTLTRRIFFGAAASWFSRGVSILLGLVLMPVLFRHLPKEELGVWLLLGQSWAVLGIFDLGFGVTLTRRIAFAKGKSGADPNARLNAESLREIADLVATGRRVYRGLALFAFSASFMAGFFYLRSLDLSAVPLPLVWLAWGVLCLSQAFGVWAAVWTCLLQGVGYIGWDAILASLVSALTLLTQMAAVLLGGGLVALAVAAASGALAQRFLLVGFARGKRPELFATKGRFDAGALRQMVPLAARAWITTLGLALALNTDQFFIARLKGAAQIPAYRAAYVILLNLNILAITLAAASGVFVAQLWQTESLEQVHRIVIRNLRLGLFIMATGGACILGLGEELFSFWLGPGNFIGYPILATFFVLLTLEAQSYIISNSSRATEDEAFAPWALGAGLLKIVLSTVLGMRWGLPGVALGTVLAQLATNDWFMVYRGLRRLRLSVRQHVSQVVLPAVMVFVLTVLAVWGVRRLLAGAPRWTVVLSGGGVAGAVLASMLWTQVLRRGERDRMLRGLSWGPR